MPARYRSLQDGSHIRKVHQERPYQRWPGMVARTGGIAARTLDVYGRSRDMPPIHHRHRRSDRVYVLLGEAVRTNTPEARGTPTISYHGRSNSGLTIPHTTARSFLEVRVPTGSA